MPNTSLLTLIGEINAGIDALTHIKEIYRQYQLLFGNQETRDLRDAIILSELLCNSYTCIETIFLRISRYFENHLEPERWHRELREKMRVEIPGVRKALISRESYLDLDELRRFRHFKRYYFDFDYDWGRLDFLQQVYERLLPGIRRELDEYIEFLEQLSRFELKSLSSENQS